jgi:hypothetical protein
MSEGSSSHRLDGRSDASCLGRIFLVHLSLDANPACGYFCGRVQHVRSEDATHFSSFADLARFMFEHIELEARAMRSPNDDPCSEDY